MSAPEHHHQSVSRFVIVGGLTAMLVVLIRTAWMSDDAYITMRTVDNFVNGFGLRWNVAERVQAFTHPAWLFLISPFYAITHEVFFTVLGLQIALTVVTLCLILVVAARSTAEALMALAALIGSKAFVEFSTSGLENPLSHLLIVVFAVSWMRDRQAPGGTFGLGLLTSLLLLCRLDFAVLLAPLLFMSLQRLDKRRWMMFIAGLSPLIVWEAFSLIYYGSLVPNTALAKLAPGVSVVELVPQGFQYLAQTFHFDPFTPVLLVACTAALLVAGGSPGRAIGTGVLLHVAYVVSVGGDFMTGRFLTPSFVAALTGTLLTVPLPRGAVRGRLLAAAMLVAGVMNPVGPLRTGAEFGLVDPPPEDYRYGVTDERRVYFKDLGLLRVLQGLSSPDKHGYAVFGRGRAGEQRPNDVIMSSSVGIAGYYAGPTVHIIDRNALADPLLSRLPPDPDWRIGHFVRTAPAGYLESCVERRNRIEDPRLHRLYDDVLLATRAPVFSAGRAAAIWRLQRRLASN